MTPAQGTSTKGKASPLFEIARLLVRLGHVASRIVNTNHSIMRTAVGFGVIDYIADRKGPRLFSPR
jgi:hypothetical protein